MRRPMLLAAVAAALIAATPAAAFAPHHGSYAGPTSHRTTITFHYSGHHITDVRVGTVWAIREAYVSTNGWSFHDREHHHTLTGHWVDATHVEGTYGYYRQTSRGLVHVTLDFRASLTN